MSTDSEAIVRLAYARAEGPTLDPEGFVELFTDDGVFRNVVGQETYQGKDVAIPVVWMANLFSDLHRELHKVTVLGDVVAVELSIQGTLSTPFPTPAGEILPAGQKVDFPTGDFWYLNDGKITDFNCYVGMSIWFAQMGALPDFAAAVAASQAAA